MMWRKAKTRLIGLACAGITLITTATCDPRTGTLNIFRDDDDEYLYFYDGFVYQEVIYYDDDDYDDCFFFACF